MAESLLNGMLLFLLLGISAALPSASSASSSSPWMDTSLCPLTDSLMMCQLKKGICSPINTIFSPAGGPVKAITTCANSTGAVLGPQFFMSVGLSFLSGSPESLADKASSDPATATAIRRCALNATGLLNPDLLTLNRTAVSNSLSSAFITPELGGAVAAAVTTCPEPINYKVADFMNCLKVACMNNVAVTPFMNQATAALTGAAPLRAASPPAAAKKTVASKNTGSAATSSSGSSAYSAGAFAYPGAGGAFPYAGAGAGAGGVPAPSGSSAYMTGAGAGSAPAASGSSAYMAGAGAGSAPAASGSSAYTAGAGGSPPASGPAPYMAGAFPYAGAGGGFPYPGAGSGASGAGAIPYTGTGGAGAGAFPYPSSSGGAAAPQSSSSAMTASSK